MGELEEWRIEGGDWRLEIGDQTKRTRRKLSDKLEFSGK